MHSVERLLDMNIVARHSHHHRRPLLWYLQLKNHRLRHFRYHPSPALPSLFFDNSHNLRSSTYWWEIIYIKLLRYLATGSADALVSLWDLDGLVCVRTFDRLE